jgi:hypothetical protein
MDPHRIYIWTNDPHVGVWPTVVTFNDGPFAAAVAIAYAIDELSAQPGREVTIGYDGTDPATREAIIKVREIMTHPALAGDGVPVA